MGSGGGREGGAKGAGGHLFKFGRCFGHNVSVLLHTNGRVIVIRAPIALLPCICERE